MSPSDDAHGSFDGHLQKKVHRLEQPKFFTRNGFDKASFWTCLDWMYLRYQHSFDDDDGGGGSVSIVPLASHQQGCCSYTFIVRIEGQEPIVVQFRLSEFRMSWNLAREVRSIYGESVPDCFSFDDVSLSSSTECERRSLQVCEMSFIEGVRCGEILPWCGSLNARDEGRLGTLLEALSRSFGVGWKDEKGKKNQRDRRSSCKGRIGSSLESRLKKLQQELPTSELRKNAGTALQQMQGGCLESLPITLTHGDLLPSNILVDAQSWELKGLVDWAEAEYLPFGMSLYGIEHLLGTLHNHQVFRYYRQADVLRDFFWTSLLQEIPEIHNNKILKAVQLSRNIGILLWHGFAWDEGCLDRVVSFEADAEELVYLEAFLGLETRSNRQSRL